MNIRSCGNTDNTLQLMHDILQFLSIIQWGESERFPHGDEVHKQPTPVRTVQVLPSSYSRAFSILRRGDTFFVPDSSYTLVSTRIIKSYITQAPSNKSLK
jgi:hypothetical protein